MASIDYFAKSEELQELIVANVSASFICVVEEELQVEPDKPFIGIYLGRREAPPDIQTISAGRTTRYNVYFSIWVYVAALEVKLAANIRDDLLGTVERELMEHRDEFADGEFWLEGGSFDSALNQDTDLFELGAEIVVVAQLDSTV